MANLTLAQVVEQSLELYEQYSDDGQEQAEQEITALALANGFTFKQIDREVERQQSEADFSRMTAEFMSHYENEACRYNMTEAEQENARFKHLEE
jgi:hypothetical protein